MDLAKIMSKFNNLEYSEIKEELKRPLGLDDVILFLKKYHYTIDDFAFMLAISTRQANRILNGRRKRPGFTLTETIIIRYVMDNTDCFYQGEPPQNKVEPIKIAKPIEYINLSFTVVDCQQPIRDAAYYLWLNSGCPEGKDLEFWYQAEKDIKCQSVTKFETL